MSFSPAEINSNYIDYLSADAKFRLLESIRREAVAICEEAFSKLESILSPAQILKNAEVTTFLHAKTSLDNSSTICVGLLTSPFIVGERTHSLSSFFYSGTCKVFFNESELRIVEQRLGKYEAFFNSTLAEYRQYIADIKIVQQKCFSSINRLTKSSIISGLEKNLCELQSVLARYDSWRALRQKLQVAIDLIYLPADPVLTTPFETCRANVSVYQFTRQSPVNPFFSEIPHGLQERGWSVRFSRNFESLRDTISCDTAEHRIVHFHQLDMHYHVEGIAYHQAKKVANEVLAHIVNLKNKGVYIVWTLHAALSQDKSYADIDDYFERKMLALADRVVVLGEASKSYVESRLGSAEKVAIMRHPSFEGLYPINFSRENARRHFRIEDDEFVICSPGRITPFKNLSLIVKAARELAQRNPDKKIRLLLLGKASSEGYLNELRRQAGEETRIEERMLTADELGRLLRAADVAAFGYLDVFTSSSAILALSTGVPVVVPRVGCLPEYVEDGVTGKFYPSGDKGELVSCLEAFLKQEIEFSSRSFSMFNRERSLDRTISQLENIYYTLVSCAHDVESQEQLVANS